MASWRGAKLASDMAFSLAENILEPNVVFQSQGNATTGGGWLRSNEKCTVRHGWSELPFLNWELLVVGTASSMGLNTKLRLKSNIYWESSLKSLQVRRAVNQLATSTALCEMSTQHLFSSPTCFTGVQRG